MSDDRYPTRDDYEARLDDEAEFRRQARDGYWDPPAEFDPPSPTGHGWAPPMFPEE